MTAKERLIKLDRLRTDIDATCDEIEQIRARIVRCTSAVTGTPRGGGGAGSASSTFFDWTDTLLKACELEDALRDKLEAMLALQSEISASIAAMPDSAERQVLTLRYVNGWRWNRIAQEMHYSVDNVWRLHRRALELYSKIK